MTLCFIRGCDSTAADQNNVCADCWDNRTALLRPIPELWLRLHGQLPKGSQGPSEAVSRPRPGSRPPLQICVLDAIASAPVVLSGWMDEALRLQGRLPVARLAMRWGARLSKAHSMLLAIDGVFYGQPEALQYLLDIASLHRRLTSLNGLEATAVRLSAPCPSCHIPNALYHHQQQRLIRCSRGRCGARWSESAYSDHILAQYAARG